MLQQFFQHKIERIVQSTRHVLYILITYLLSVRATTSWNMLINIEFKADTSTGNLTRNSCCHTLASHDLNMCSFGQSTRLIESRCVVILMTSSVATNGDKVGIMTILGFQWYTQTNMTNTNLSGRMHAHTNTENNTLATHKLREILNTSLLRTRKSKQILYF